MYIYIHPFVLDIIATVVFEVGVCFVVGLISSKKNNKQDNTDNDKDETNQDN